MLKIGILGCGAIADAHAWAIQRIAGCKIIAACDAEELMAKLFCERFHVPHAFGNLSEMLQQARPDVIHILTPPQNHYAAARECLEQNCHVYVEKPLTLNIGEAEELFRLSEQKKLKLTVGHDVQFGPATRELRRLVQDGYLGGAPVHMEGYYGYDFGDLYGNAVLGDKRHWVRRLPGKLLQNVISHGIARIAEYLPGNQPQVIAHGFVSAPLQKVGEKEIVDELRVIVSDETGATAYYTFSSRIRPNLNQFRIYGPKNGLFLDESQQTVVKLRGGKFKSYAEIFVPPAIFGREYLRNIKRNLGLFLSHDLHMESGKKILTESFYRSITEGAPDPIPYRQIWMTTWIMDQIFEQISTAPKAVASRPMPQNFPVEISVADNSRKSAPPSANRAGLIINADDWGRSRLETDRTLSCCLKGRVTSVSAMVFMKDSERAAELAKQHNLDVGLHLNLAENFTGRVDDRELFQRHAGIVRYMSFNKFAKIFYNPFFDDSLKHICQAQLDEFLRLYGKPPSHIDGHRHNHLCTNLLIHPVIPKGQKVRRSFTFINGEKGRFNLTYRKIVDKSLAKRYMLTDYFFSLYSCLKESQMGRIAELASKEKVELMAHPIKDLEYEFLMSDKFDECFGRVKLEAFSKPDQIGNNFQPLLQGS